MQKAGPKIDIAENLGAVRRRIALAAERAGRNADEIKLVAVSKTHPPEVLREAISAGIRTFGENQVQEGAAKVAKLGSDAAEWHLIGHLQSNKARIAVNSFDVIETLDSIKLAERLERICIEENRASLPVFAQVDLAGETTKSGVSVTVLWELADFLKNCQRLRFNGLMIVPPYFEDAEMVRPFFARLRGLRDELARQDAFAGGAGELSMGMSHDFEIAVEEGATVLRVGTAIFGERDYS